jgi:hypothetical protein
MGLPLHGAVNFLYQGIGIARYATFVRSTFGTTVARDQLVSSFRFVLRRSRINHRKVGKRHIAVGADTLSTGRILDPNVSGSAEEHEIDFTAFTAFYRQ